MPYFHAALGFLSGLGLAWLLIWTSHEERKLTSFHFAAFWKKGWYALLGFLTAFVFFLNSTFFAETGYELFLWHLLSLLLLASALYDLAFRLIPVFVIVLSFLLTALMSLTVSFPLEFVDSLRGAGVVGGLVFLLYVATRRKGIGEADIFLGLIIGVLFGWYKGLLVFSAANIFGLLILLPLIAVFGKEKMKQVPLVTFMVIAIFLEWYLQYTDIVLRYLTS